MAHITLICGNQPTVVADRMNHGTRMAQANAGSWEEHLRRLGNQPFRRPPDSVVFADGSEATLEQVGDDGMRAILGSMSPSEPVTVVQAVG
jgi:hypothetical protein